MTKVDFLLIGRGLAGCLLSWELKRRGSSISMIGINSPGAASRVSSGVINPVTGRRYVKGWRFEELKKVYTEFYSQLESHYNRTFSYTRDMLVILNGPGDENSWLLRQHDEAYSNYCHNVKGTVSDLYRLDENAINGLIPGIAQVDIPAVVDCVIHEMKEGGWLHEEEFYYEKLYFKSHGEFIYDEKIVATKGIVFCEGFGVINNPYFNWIPHALLKGERLLFEAASREQRILNASYSVVPMKNYFWLGSNYDKQDSEPFITEMERKNQLAFAKETLGTEINVLDHDVGIRLASRNRRPILGSHPENPGMYILNGFGTKGASMIPYCVRHLSDHLTKGHNILPEADVKRFVKNFYRTL